jgi:hypothetical protein
MPPIGSVFHLDGVLNGNKVEEVDRESYAKVYKTKVDDESWSYAGNFLYICLLGVGRGYP